MSGDKFLVEELAKPGWKDAYIRALHYADFQMRRYVWRGHKPTQGKDGELIVDGWAAADFLQEALIRLCKGTRKYDTDRTLEENLKSVVESIIWSHKKTSDTKPILEVVPLETEEGQEIDPIEEAADPSTQAGDAVVLAELIRERQAMFNDFRTSLDGEAQLTALADAYAAGFTITGEIAELTGIPPERISELKRKLRTRALRFFGVRDFSKFNEELLGGER